MAADGLRHRRFDIGRDVNQKERSNTPTRTVIDGGRFVLLMKVGLILVIILPLSLLLLVDLFVQSPIDPVSFSLPKQPNFEGALAQNDLLVSSQRLYLNKLKGPESVVVRQGHIYTGTSDGKILHLHKGDIETIATIGTPPCGRFEDEPTCGRPLGMRFDKDGYLIVADAYLGLYKVNVATGDVHTYFHSSKKIGGKESKFLNDIDIAKDGTVYLTDSSTNWDRRHYPYLLVENKPDGRLIKYHPETNTTTLLADGLHFPNGVQLSRNEDFLLIPETSMCRVLRYYLKGSKAGTIEVFADNLPGLPDNIRRSSSGGYWVGIAIIRRPEFSLYDFLANKPWIRRFLTKIASQDMIVKQASWKGPHGLIVELDESGTIRRSLHDPTGKVIPAVSEVEDDAGTLYFGSYYAPFIGKYIPTQNRDV